MLSERVIDEQCAVEWAEVLRDNFACTLDDVRPTRHDIESVLNYVRHSSVGPDCVPFDAYRYGGLVVADLVDEVISAMLEDGVDPPVGFNNACLVCLGKKREYVDQMGRDMYLAKNTWPLSIVDAVSRILAFIFLRGLVRCIAHRISESHRGFLPGRHMIQNIIEMDVTARVTSSKYDGAVLCFLDFQADFCSISRTWLWRCLETPGLPLRIVRVVQKFYMNTSHSI